MQNIDGGIALFNSKKGQVIQHYQNVYTQYPNAPHLTESELRYAIYQFYNGGYYWEWDASSKAWTKNVNPKYVAYGDDAVRIEELGALGHPPADWS